MECKADDGTPLRRLRRASSLEETPQEDHRSIPATSSTDVSPAGELRRDADTHRLKRCKAIAAEAVEQIQGGDAAHLSVPPQTRRKKASKSAATPMPAPAPGSPDSPQVLPSKDTSMAEAVAGDAAHAGVPPQKRRKKAPKSAAKPTPASAPGSPSCPDSQQVLPSEDTSMADAVAGTATAPGTPSPATNAPAPVGANCVGSPPAAPWQVAAQALPAEQQPASFDEKHSMEISWPWLHQVSRDRGWSAEELSAAMGKLGESIAFQKRSVLQLSMIVGQLRRKALREALPDRQAVCEQRARSGQLSESFAPLSRAQRCSDVIVVDDCEAPRKAKKIARSAPVDGFRDCPLEVTNRVLQCVSLPEMMQLGMSNTQMLGAVMNCAPLFCERIPCRGEVFEPVPRYSRQHSRWQLRPSRGLRVGESRLLQFLAQHKFASLVRELDMTEASHELLQSEAWYIAVRRLPHLVHVRVALRGWGDSGQHRQFMVMLQRRDVRVTQVVLPASRWPWWTPNAPVFDVRCGSSEAK